MLDSLISGPAPAVSIILPTYNRAKFLPQAFESIRSQSFTDWELIVVDDGSTDSTRELVASLTAGWKQTVRYVFQENRGAYGARNTGLDHAVGRFIAFFDSDDIWLPHHLQECVTALQTNPDVDWVFAACEIFNSEQEKVTSATHFRMAGVDAAFLALDCQDRDGVHVIVDPNAVTCAILHSLSCGLQHSVISRRVFENSRFVCDFRNEAEDQLAVIRALSHGFRFAYIDAVHVRYVLHENNYSAAAIGANLNRLTYVFDGLTRGFELLPCQIELKPQERRALKRRLGREYFWLYGYAVLWQRGQRARAIEMYRKGLAHCPWNLRYWRTYILAEIRWRLNIGATPGGSLA